MPPQKRISALLDLSLASIRGLVCEEALRVARVAVTSFVYDELEQSVRNTVLLCHCKCYVNRSFLNLIQNYGLSEAEIEAKNEAKKEEQEAK